MQKAQGEKGDMQKETRNDADPPLLCVVNELFDLFVGVDLLWRVRLDKVRLRFALERKTLGIHDMPEDVFW